MEVIDNRFRIIKKLYTSEIADTYLTEDTKNNNQLVDVKLLMVNKYISNVLFNMFKAETLVIKGMDHIGLPKYITSKELGTEDERFFYVAYKHPKGIVLKEYLEHNHYFIEKNYFEICFKVLSILEYLERKNILHKSISTENILVDDELNVSLINFGAIQNKLNSGRDIEPIIGNINFMPTEQKLGFATAKTDQYALGYLFIAMHIKKTLESDIETLELFNKVNDINPNLRKFINILINKDSTERFVKIKNAKEIFEKIMNGEDVLVESGHLIDSEKNLEDEYIAQKIVDNETAYRDIEANYGKKKEKKTSKLIYYLIFIAFWIYLVYYMLGFLVNMVEFEDKSYKKYHRENNKKILDVYKKRGK